MKNLSKENLSKKDLLLVGLMLFSLFFGAGNLIFPPFLGQAAGGKTYLAMATFFITTVGFPILGVVAVAKSGGLTNLAKRVNAVFAVIFTVLIYLSIGPCLGIPRAGSLPFEMVVAPYLPASVSKTLALLLYTFTFFMVAYWLSLSPAKLVDRMGKVLTPSLLILILVIFLGSLFKPLGGYGQATGEYITSPLVKGFLDGYLTMDTIAALNFGIVIALAIKSRGVKDEKVVVSASIKAGVIAGILLILIYSMLAHLGASSGGRFDATENGAQTLTNVSTYIFGKPGAVLLAVVFTLACLTTSVGLITSCSQYFQTLNNKISYKSWVRILCISSMILANMGLTKILSISVPILNAIYPISIMLIVLAMLDNLFKESSIVYGLTILFTGVVSIVDALGQVGIKLGVVTHVCSSLPLYGKGLGWVTPAVFGMVLGFIFKVVKEKSTCPKFTQNTDVK
ncbi:branched-chain amino acid transport system II carrier protein [Clostridium sporogenes]|uniref:branched-chain amino acid transport system II carrier protein n=1 Tax=Clostridium sporogenes TaxID=1509 RepID=UPI0013D4B4CE|nr:branched-chain amino acid transport system II carrier protein [Clostridium sporogenes]MBA4507086.1 branched-chain amino acid transport system II carrier protein [Clostridium sporogenes]MDU6335033.1 branched-chain amino acid transport system II carrier protein [Clostridium sporogenes]NFQ87232.1 branched-chain amino acid transport system II carrier protein [Clostridium sporogenes]